MKMITTSRQVEIITAMFDQYVEHVASSFMCGEVPSTVFAVHRRGTKEQDWLAMVRFKNTLTISVFRCEVWLEDIVRLCRKCKIWLITDEIYQIVSLYFMLHPLFQTQYMDFSHEINTDYDSMIAGAGTAAYKFIQQHFPFTDPIQKIILDILNYHNMIFTNHFNKNINPRDAMERARNEYVNYMMDKHPCAYKTSIHFKASMSLVGDDGYMQLERTIDMRGIKYIRQEDQHETEHITVDPLHNGKKPFSKKPIKKSISSNCESTHTYKTLKRK